METSTFVSRGWRGTWRHLPAFGVAGVALGDIYLRLAWQAWHLLHLVARLVAVGRRWSPLVAVGRPGRRATLRGRRGTWRPLPSFRVAGVALGDIYLRLAWQAWHLGHLLHLVARLVAVGRRWSPCHFAWQAWHLETFTFVLRGRRGTWRHLPALGVAGVALVRFTWQAWHLETSTFVSRGRRGTWRHLLAFGVAGVALGDIYLRLAWQAWHLLHLVVRLWHALVAVGRPFSFATFTRQA